LDPSGSNNSFSDRAESIEGVPTSPSRKGESQFAFLKEMPLEIKESGEYCELAMLESSERQEIRGTKERASRSIGIAV
jgi:hypothetical protein